MIKFSNFISTIGEAMFTKKFGKSGVILKYY